MWMVILIILHVSSFECHAEDSSSTVYVNVTQSSVVSEVINFNGTEILTNNNNLSAVGNISQNNTLEYPMLHLTRWKSVNLPINFNPYKEQNPRSTESEEMSDKQSKPPLRNSISDMNKNASMITNNTERKYPVYFDSINHYPYPFVQNQLPAVMVSPILYPNSMSINLRRNYITDAGEVQNPTDTITSIPVADPISSNSHEEKFQTLPNLPFSTIPMPPNSDFTFDKFRNQFIFHPLSASFYFKPYAMLPTTEKISRNETRKGNLTEEDKEESSRSVADTFSEQRLSEIQKPVTAANLKSTLNAPFGLSEFIRSISSGRLPLRMPPIFNPLSNQTTSASSLKQALIPEAVDVPSEITTREYVPGQVPIMDRFVSNTTSLPQEDALSERIVDNGEDIDASENIKISRIPYEFGYDMNDGNGTDQYRKEVSDVSGVVKGSYGYRDLFGVYRLVNYIADRKGFRAFVKSNEPGIANSESADVIVIAENTPSATEAAKIREYESIDIEHSDLTQKKKKEVDKPLRDNN